MDSLEKSKELAVQELQEVISDCEILMSRAKLAMEAVKKVDTTEDAEQYDEQYAFHLEDGLKHIRLS